MIVIAVRTGATVLKCAPLPLPEIELGTHPAKVLKEALNYEKEAEHEQSISSYAARQGYLMLSNT